MTRESLIPKGKRSSGRRAEDVMLRLAQAMSSPIREDFFESLVREAIALFDAKGGLIALRDEVDQAFLRSITFVANGALGEEIRFRIEGTPNADIVKGGDGSVFDRRVQERFPLDPLLSEFGVESYAGAPICSKDGAPVGVLAIFGEHPIGDSELVLSAVRILASRVSAELDRRNADRQRQKSQSLLEVASSLAHWGGWSVELPELQLTWSDEVRAIHEVPSSFVPVVDEALAFYAPEARPIVTEAFERCMSEGVPYDLELRIVTARGRPRWVRALGRAERDSMGRVVRIWGAFQDISKQKEAEEKILHQGHLMRIAGETAKVAGWAVEASGMRFRAARELNAMLGFEEGADLRLEDVFGRFLPESRDLLSDELPRCIDGGVPLDLELEVIGGRGEKRAVRFVAEAERDASGAIARVRGALQDVTERKENERSIRRSQERFRQLADSMPLIVWTATADGVVDYSNREFSEYTGISQEEPPGERWGRTVHPDDFERCSEVWGRCVREGTPYELEFRVRRAVDGCYRWHLARATPIRDESGRVSMWYGTATDIHDAKHMQDEARRLAERFATTLESITDAFITLDRDWRCTFLNSEAERLLGRGRQDLLGSVVWDALPDLRGSKIEEALRAAVAKDEPIEIEECYGALDVWLGIRAYPSDIGLAIYFRDESQRRRAEIELRESRRQLMTLMDNLPGLVYRCRNDRAWSTELVSAGAIALTGWAPTDYLERRVEYVDLVHPEDLERVRRSMKAAVEEQRPFELVYRIRTRSGDEKWVWERGQAVRGPDTDDDFFEGFVSDITGQKRAQDELRISEERFRLLCLATNDAVWDWDLVTDEVTWNEGFEHLFGYRRDEVEPTSVSWSGRLHPDDRDRVLEGVHATIDGGSGNWSSEYRFLCKDGTYVHVIDRGYVIRDERGRCVRMIGGMTDQTERRALEQQLRHSQKMESVGRLAGGVAHDFNNLLTVILGAVDFAIASLGPDNPVKGELMDVRRAGEQAANLTRQLLAFSRRQVLQPRLLVLDATIREMLSLLRRLIGEDVEIDFRPSAGSAAILADAGQIEQVLVNLVVNARDAMPGGGTIRIETSEISCDATPMDPGRGASSGRHLLLSVSDTGDGMSEDAIEHLFEPFFTTKAAGKGTGLGLATVYGIVQQSGGSISVESAAGKGTTFRVRLPVVERNSESEKPQRTAPRQRFAETILIVEDDPSVGRVAERILRSGGYTVLRAGGGEEALALLAAYEGTVHLTVTDVVMPGMGGPELGRHLAERYPDMRVLYTSGYTDDEVVHRGVSIEGMNFLSKPYTVDGLKKRVRDVLDAES